MTWGVAVALSVATFVHVIATVSSEITGPDNSVLWYAVPEWTHLRLHEPGFYGQSYGSTFDAIPAAALHAVGVGLAWAVPIGLGLSILTVWFALGWAAARRGHPTVALLAYAGPVLLSSYYVVFVTVVPVERAFALVGIGVAMLLVRSRHAWVTALGVAVTGVAVAIDASSLVLVAPIAVWFALDLRRRTELVPVLVGLIPAVAYFVYRLWFYRAHPDHDLHGALPLRPSFDVLGRVFDDPYPVFRLFALEVLREWWMPLAAGAVVLVVVLARRRATTAVPAVLVLVFTLYAVSTPRAGDRAGLFLPPARVLLMVPFALWFLVFLLAETRPSFPGWVRPAVVAVVMVLAAVSFTERLVGSGTHDPAVVHHEALTSILYAFEPVRGVERDCDRIEAAAARAGADLVVLPLGGTRAFACAGRTGNTLETLDIPFERRTWLLERAARVPVRTVLVRPVPSDFCAVARRRAIRCRQAHGVAVLTARRQPALNLLALIGLSVRPFGPGCRIVGTRCAGGTDARRAFPEPVGTVPAAARTEVGEAWRGVLRGDSSWSEPMPGVHQTVAAIERRRHGRPVPRLRNVSMTGPRSVRAEVRGAEGAPQSVEQFVLVDGRWRVARSTVCAVAVDLGAQCTPLLGLLG